ncbi:hypothetical protein CYMTET_9783 [Cymbomonas tetramitiformis]|uniref:Pentatricopeptide repeat-containing protein n=1 Tax=Cymbomonas tetramitiformis TaxID=36881 RepID=A0AAE0LF50_9CHLO|nr:hypothetical protein CYMTET_9783 [Cymbomonas tetramitiformis]
MSFRAAPLWTSGVRQTTQNGQAARDVSIAVFPAHLGLPGSQAISVPGQKKQHSCRQVDFSKANSGRRVHSLASEDIGSEVSTTFLQDLHFTKTTTSNDASVSGPVDKVARRIKTTPYKSDAAKAGAEKGPRTAKMVELTQKFSATKTAARLQQLPSTQENVSYVLDEQFLSGPQIASIIVHLTKSRSTCCSLKVLQWAEDMGKATRNQYNLVMNGLADKGRWENTEEVFERMRNNPDIVPNGRTFSARINAFAKGGQVDKAKTTLAEMALYSIEPTVFHYCTVISACAKSSRWREAEAIFKRMKEAGVTPNTITYNAIISAYTKPRACLTPTKMSKAVEIMAKEGHLIGVFEPFPLHSGELSMA